MNFKNIKNLISIRKSALISKKDESKYIKIVFDVVAKNFHELQNINTDGLKPADFPYELKKTFLRNDEIKEIYPEKFKKNINTNQQNFVVLKGAKNE